MEAAFWTSLITESMASFDSPSASSFPTRAAGRTYDTGLSDAYFCPSGVKDPNQKEARIVPVVGLTNARSQLLQNVVMSLSLSMW